MTERSEGPERVHAIARGRVQGVGFRAFTHRTAEALDLSGWVRNCRDGAVEAHFEGPATATASLVEALREGPRFGRVDELEIVSRAPATGSEAPLPHPFEVRH